MTKNKLISIVIPMYNAEEYISNCLGSINKQNFKEFEVIIINDGSIDNSYNLAKKFEYLNPGKFKIFSQENSGVSSARNFGIKEAQGDYILFLDSDDSLEPDALDKLSNVITKTDAEIIVFGGHSLPTVDWIDKNLSTKDKEYFFDSCKALFHETGSFPFLWNKIFKRDFLLSEAILFNQDLDLGEDLVFLFKLFPAARKIKFINQKIYIYRTGNSDSLMGKYNSQFKNKYNTHVKICQLIINHWKEQGYLSSNERDLTRWVINFFEKAVLKENKNIKFFSNKVKDILQAINYNPSPEDNFSEKYIKILKKANEEQNIKISVIMPVFNSEEFLKEAIESILNQSFKEFELIVVDDGSTDNSLKILREYEDLDERITVLTQKNQYAGVARNHAMTYAQGDYLLFLDSDDIFDKNLLKNLFDISIKKNADISLCGVKSLDMKSGETKPMPWFANSGFFKEKEVFSRKNRNRNLFCFTTGAPWNKLFSKKFILENNLFFQNTRSANDAYFVWMSISLAERIVLIKDELITYRINNNKSLQGSQEKDIYSFYEALIKTRDGLIKKSVMKEVEDIFINFSLDFCLYNLHTIKDEIKFKELFNFLNQIAFDELKIKQKNTDFFYGYKKTNGLARDLVLKGDVDNYISYFDIKFIA